MYVSGCCEACVFLKVAVLLGVIANVFVVEPNVTSKKLELLVGGAIGGLSSELTTCPTTKGSEAVPCWASWVAFATTGVGDG